MEIKDQKKLALTLDVSLGNKLSRQYESTFFLLSSSVVHIMQIIVKINHVHFYIYVLIISGQCIQNARIKLVNHDHDVLQSTS